MSNYINLLKGFPILLIFWILLGSCSQNKNTSQKAEPKIIIQPIHVKEVVGLAEIAPENEIIPISSEIGGVVSLILKKENDSVKKGEIILELNHTINNAKIDQNTSQIKSQMLQIKVDQASVVEYQAKYANAQVQLKRLEKLLADGAESGQNVDDAKTNLLSFGSNLLRLQGQVKVSISKLSETKAALELTNQEKNQKIIRSPVNGKILQIDPVLGSTVDNKNSFGQISPIGKIIAICEIDELFANSIKVGQKAWIRNLGSLDTLATGKIYFASSYLKKKSLFADLAGEKEDRRVRQIKIVLDNPEKLLLNSRVEAVINISQ
jgi:multidrug efflux pump subunit AcrA (membrane-fusion protein)